MTESTDLHLDVAQADTPDVHADLLDGHPRVIICTAESSAKSRAQARGFDTSDHDWEDKYQGVVAYWWVDANDVPPDVDPDALRDLESIDPLRAGFQLTPRQATELAERLLEAVRQLDQATPSNAVHQYVWANTAESRETQQKLQALLDKLTGPN